MKNKQFFLILGMLWLILLGQAKDSFAFFLGAAGSSVFFAFAIICVLEEFIKVVQRNSPPSSPVKNEDERAFMEFYNSQKCRSDFAFTKEMEPLFKPFWDAAIAYRDKRGSK
jgi:lysylphosphatidylglycerol synthetase-like protein (DUF2156 family)